jgi:signal transduction histidine kinase/tetratricopeptide (TPR) repeat protein
LRKQIVYLIIFFAGCISNLEAQSLYRIDSLRGLLKKNLSVQKRIDVFNELSFALYDNSDSIAFYYANLSFKEATKAGYQAGAKYACTLIGIGYAGMGQLDEALGYCKKSLHMNANLSRDLVGYNLTVMGNVYSTMGSYDSAQYYYKLAIETIGKTGSAYYLSSAYQNLAGVLIIQWRNNEALKYLDKADSLSLRDKKDNFVHLSILGLYGEVYEHLLDFAKAEIYFKQMYTEAKQGVDTYHLVQSHLNFAELAFRRGNFSESLLHSFDALKVTETYSSKSLRASVLIKIGLAYEEYSQFDLATSYFFEALRITESIKFKRETAEIYSELAWVYKEQRNYDVALDYINRAQVIREMINDQQGVSNCLNIRGLIFFQQKRYDNAISELEKSVHIRELIGHIEGVSASTFNLALVYAEINRVDEAIEYQLKGIDIEEKIDNKQSLAISYNSISELYVRKGNIKEAEKYLEKARKLALLTKSKMVMRNNYGFYAKLFRAKEDYKKAFESQVRYQELNDSIYSEGSAVKLAEMQALYQVEQKEQQIKLLGQEKQIQEDELALQQAKIKQQGIIIVSVLGGILFISVLAFLIFRYNQTVKRSNIEILEQKEEIQAQSEELIEANQTIAQINKSLEVKIEQRTAELKQAFKELDIFFYRSSHDFRRPLTTFLGLAEVAKITVKDPNALELFSKVKETATNLDKMLIKLQSISDVGAHQLVYKETFIKEIYDDVCDGFRDEIQKNGIHITSDIDPLTTFNSYPAMMRTILENLVENSIQFRGFHDPYIKLKAYVSVEEIIIEVQDNGQGIERQYQERIFEMYFRGNERSKGNGLGLYIVKKAVEKLNGYIEFETTWGVGSLFRLRFVRP